MRTHLFVLFLLAVATCATPKKIEAPVEKSEAPHPSFWDTAAYEELPESSDFSTRYGIVAEGLPSPETERSRATTAIPVETCSRAMPSRAM
jgi:hypothetical protein